jgi:lipopolysaccharide export system permease protein
LVFVGMTLALGEWVAPPAERMAQQLRLQAIGRMVGREFRTGLWVKDGSAFVNVRDVQPDGTLLNVRIYEFDEGFRLTATRVAARGHYQDEGHWRLSDVVENRYTDTGSSVRSLPEQAWQTGLTPDVVSVLLVAPERMSIGKLTQYVGYLDENRRKTERYEIALWKKLVYPLACLVMMFLALPFGFLQDRAGNISAKVFAGVMLGIGFHMLNGLFSNLGAINNWSPPLAAMAPSVLFLLIAVGLVWRLERR